MNPVPTRVLLVDDHEVVRYGLRSLLEASAGYTVCGEAADGRAGVELADSLRPDIVVMDIGMPELNGFEATRQVLERCPQTRILILSMHQSDQLVKEVLAAGAHGYVLKSDAARHLIAALDALREGRSFFTERIAALLSRGEESDAGANGKARRTELTRRELEIVQLLSEGKSNKDVARALDISVKTAEGHRASIMRKLRVESLAEIVRYAIRNKIADL
jgi:DNA-binding NarL/FixJ family response regulator